MKLLISVLSVFLAVLMVFNVCRLSMSGVYVPATYEEEYFPALDKTLIVYKPAHYEYNFLSLENVLSKLSAIEYDITDEVKAFENNMTFCWNYFQWCIKNVEESLTSKYSIQKLDWTRANPLEILEALYFSFFEIFEHMFGTIYYILMSATSVVVAVFFMVVLLVDFLFMLISALFVFIDTLFYFIGIDLNLTSLLDTLNSITFNTITLLKNFVNTLANIRV